MEMFEIVYREYVRLVERHDKLLDSSFDDIKLFGVLGSALGIVGAMMKNNFKYIDENESYFVIILVLFFLIAIIAFRDLLKQVYIVHLTYNIKKIEDHIREDYKEIPDLFTLRKSWHEKYYLLMKKSYYAFIVVFFLPLIILPIYLFQDCGTKYGIFLSTIMVATLILYTLLISRIYETSRKNETSIKSQE